MATIDLNHHPRLADMLRLASSPMAESVGELERAARTTRPEALADRTGFDESFIEGFAVPTPVPIGPRADDVLAVPGSGSGRLDYQHFSVVMSRSRRIALFVAVNIDGSATRDVERDNDRWSLDGRILAEAQIGEDLYRDNLLDRGHLVRRLDPVWGAPDVARRANDDTFHFTNCAPQMGALNQRTWLSLENYVLAGAKAAGERISVFTGPVFGDDDPLYRGVRIPRAFWKVVAFVSDDGKPSATAYLVDQDRELRALEAVFGAYRTYQRSIASIESMTGLSFGRLSTYDGFTNEERALGVEISARLESAGDIRV